MMKKLLSVIFIVVMMFSITAISLTVDAASKNNVKTSITKVESKAKGFKVTWKKKSKIKGYQIQYSTSSKFKKSSTKTKTISKAKTKSATISKLKGCNKKYYVRVRTYKVSNGKKVYSSWSKPKKVTTLKHKYNKATCTKAKTCKYCKKTSGEASGHSWKEATCTEGKTCSVCKKTNGKALGHSYKKGVCAKCKKSNCYVVVKEYAGRWYLDGYSDIYIDIGRLGNDEAMHIEAVGINLPYGRANEESYVPYYQFVDGLSECYHGIDIPFSTWQESLDDKNIEFGDEFIKLGNRNFVRKIGSIDKYTGTFCKEAIGTWYLQNNPNCRIIIKKVGENELEGDIYSVQTFNFDLIKSNNDENDFVILTAADKEDWNELGILVSDENLTVTNQNGKSTFNKIKTYQKVSGVILDTTYVELSIGKSMNLKVTVLPSNAHDKSVIWSSSNSSVAVVSSSGVVTANSEGTTVITVKTQDGNYIATCKVNVLSIHVDGISLNEFSLNMNIGDIKQLSATITPTNAHNKAVIWSSDNENVAEVSSDGKITAKGKGTATITVKSIDGGYTANCEVAVNEPELIVTASIGIGYYMSSSVSVRGIFCEVIPSGGSGSYVDYYIKLYYNGTLVAEAAKNEVIVALVKNGTYTAEVYVKDSSGNEAIATKTMYVSC